jgi:hypothetical protein
VGHNQQNLSPVYLENSSKALEFAERILKKELEMIFSIEFVDEQGAFFGTIILQDEAKSDFSSCLIKAGLAEISVVGLCEPRNIKDLEQE